MGVTLLLFRCKYNISKINKPNDCNICKDYTAREKMMMDNKKDIENEENEHSNDSDFIETSDEIADQIDLDNQSSKFDIRNQVRNKRCSSILDMPNPMLSKVITC